MRNRRRRKRAKKYRLSESLGVSGSHVVLAHCIHLDAEEMELLTQTRTNVAHCPSSNLKLGSGLARVAEMLARKIPVSIGADGAACNNRLDMFTEMRTAALLQKLAHGPEMLPAMRVLQMATIDGARALGLDHEIGSIEIGKRADVIVVNLECLQTSPAPDTFRRWLFSPTGRCAHHDHRWAGSNARRRIAHAQ
jgi:5-methylthioadenosine/S-adenosylhomocysteine deaminase